MQDINLKIEGLDIAISYYNGGDSSPVFLMLHGWGVDRTYLDNLASELQKSGISSYTVDLPGFGNSSEPNLDWNLDSYVDFIEKVVGELNLNDLYLFGHSFGGRIAIKYSLLGSEKLKGTVLCAAAGILHKDEKIDKIKTISQKGKPIFEDCPICKPFYGMARKVWQKFFGSSDYHNASETMKSIFKNVITEDLRLFMEKIKTPTLIVWGDQDNFVPVEDAYIMNKEIKNSHLEIIKGGKHNIYRIYPEKVVGFIKDYFSL